MERDLFSTVRCLPTLSHQPLVVASSVGYLDIVICCRDCATGEGGQKPQLILQAGVVSPYTPRVDS